jgi:pimeloyl-ACP methyl ester carboxylesterase
MSRASGWLALVALASCAPLRAPVPMAVRADALAAGGARCLIVFLPGLGDRARTFFDEGFVDLVRRKGLSADVVAADATYGYYASGTFVTRLDADVIAPAKRKGYARIWLIGPSMGGFGSIFYASQRPAQLDGVLAFAPWLGDDALLQIGRAHV